MFQKLSNNYNKNHFSAQSKPYSEYQDFRDMKSLKANNFEPD